MPSQTEGTTGGLATPTNDAGGHNAAGLGADCHPDRACYTCNQQRAPALASIIAARSTLAVIQARKRLPKRSMARQSKPEEAVGGAPNGSAGRFEAQQPVRAPSPKEAMQSPASARNPAAAAVSPPPNGNSDLRARTEEEHEQALKRSERVGRRAVLSICDGCMTGSRSLARGKVPREEVGEDGLAYRLDDLH